MKTITLEMSDRTAARMAVLREKFAMPDNGELIRLALNVLHTLANHPGKVVMEGVDGGEDRELVILS